MMIMRARNEAGTEPQGDAAVTHDYATCVARKHGGVRILEKLPHTDDETDLVFGTSRYGEVNCGPRKRVVGGRFMRGGAAEYLLETGTFEQEVFDMPNNEELARLGPDARSAIIFIQIGECAAKANPTAVTALLATEVKSEEEMAAFQPLIPAVGGCVPEGLDFGIPPLLLRAYLAEGAYRNTVADRAASTEDTQ
jgi:hypothetical protein